MKVLLFVEHFNRGGTESQLVQTANDLALDDRFEIHVGCNRGGPLFERLQVPKDRIHMYNFHRFYSPGGLRQIHRLARDIRSHGFDVIHAQDFYANVTCVAACELIRRPALIVSRRYDRRPWWAHRLGEWWCYRRADLVVFNSQLVADRVVQEGGVADSKAIVIPNGLAMGRFSEHRWERDRGDFDPRAPRTIGAVGRLHPNKGHDTLIRVVARLATKWPTLTLDLVGGGEQRVPLERLARELGIEDRVRFVGEVQDVASLLPAFDVAVLPSHRGEGLPNVLLEYMAAGCPVVATRVGGVPEVARDGQEAFLVPPEDEDSLLGAVDELLGSESSCQALSASARMRSADFDKALTAQRMGELYTSVVDHAGTSAAHVRG